ncbi:MAG: glycosyltransferase family 4 protein [bacterium]|nr:glycosyltransferase family 4 protein [bacterium]
MTTSPSPRIVIDGSMARGGGGFTYLVNVIPVLVALAPDHEFLLLVHRKDIADDLPELPNLEIRQVPDTGFVARIWWIFVDAPRLAREWNADLFFSVTEYAPLRGPFAVIAAFRNRAIFTPVEQGWPIKQRVRLGVLRLLARATAGTASRIVFVSEDSAREIAASIDLAHEKMRVVHHGIDVALWGRDRARPDSPADYILSVSSIYRYKNFVPLIQGWAELCERRPETPDLVIIGDDQDAEYSSEMDRVRGELGALGERLHILGEVPYSDVPAWYQHASVFVFPSYLETFGHPLLEAMASRTALIASDIPVFREIAGDAALYADPNEPSEFASRLERVLFEQGVRDDLIEAGRRRLTGFSWQRTAERLLEVFEETLRSR